MKGPLIKSGEQEQGQLILLLIRPDKAGAGQQRGVPDPTAPRAPQPSPRLAARPGFDRVCGTGCRLPASSTHEAEGGQIHALEPG